jgi:hypothetical protein
MNGTLEWAGPIRQCGNGTVTWTIGPGAQVLHSGTAANYSWSQYNTTSGQSSKLKFNGTSGAHVTVGKKLGSVNSGPFGILSASGTSGNGNGNIDASYTDFSDTGTSSIDSFYMKIYTAQTLTWNQVTITSSGKVNIEFRVATSGMDWNGVSISSPIGTTAYTFLSAAAASGATRQILNSYFEGFSSTSCSAGTVPMDLTLQNFVTRSTAGDGFSGTGSNCTGITSGMLTYSQRSPSGASDHIFWQPGTLSDIVSVRYLDSGQVNYHPTNFNVTKPSTIDRAVFDGNLARDSDHFELFGEPASTTDIALRNFMGLCNHAGLSNGSGVNYDGPAGTKSNARITVENMTWCAGLASSADEVVMAIGAESASTFGPGLFASVSNNIAWLPTAGVVRLICLGIGSAVFDPAMFTSVENNNIWSTTSGAYCPAAIAAGGTSTTDTANNPRFVDTARHFAYFDRGFLGDSLAAAQWTSGTSYNAGDLVWDQQSSVWGNQQLNWRATGTCTASSTNRPITGTGWTTCWEPAALQRVRDLVLSGQTTWTGKQSRFQGKGVIAAFVQWIQDGLLPQNPAVWAAGTSGTFQGAVDPTPLRIVTGIL